MATLDPRLGDSHWGVPGPDGDFGFGGHCFPKDLAALIEITNNSKTNKYEHKVKNDTMLQLWRYDARIKVT